MTKRENTEEPSGGPGRYECVDPTWGDRLWQLDNPDLDGESERRLRNHLMFCDACRLRRAFAKGVAETLASEAAPTPPQVTAGQAETADSTTIADRPHARTALLTMILSYGGGLLLAAGVVLILIGPPRPRGDEYRLRASGRAPFDRPVEGEVLVDRTPRLSWRAVEGAVRYKLLVDQRDGDYEWHGETTDLALEIPDAAALPPACSFRAVLEPVPRDLAPVGGLGVSFRTGDFADWAVHRLANASPVVQAIGLAGLASCLAALFSALIRRLT